MTFREMMLSDFLGTILNNDELSENVSYTPSGSSARTIKAVIVRERIEPNGPDRGNLVFRSAEIYIANHSASGVSTVTKNRDIVSFPVQIGESNVDWTVTEILDKDDAAFHIRVVRK